LDKKKIKILAFAGQAGGAAALAPICRAILAEEWQLQLLSKDPGSAFFRKEGMEPVDVPFFNPTALTELCEEKLQGLPDLVITSATSLPFVDMTEKYLWRWGDERDIVTVGILDQWQNYALRFSGLGDKDRLAYLPDYIFVMDEWAKKEMIEEGISEELIVITGQPAFDTVLKEHNDLISQRDNIKDELGISKQAAVVTFVAEALRKDFGDALGYDEQTTLKFLGDTLNEISDCNKNLEIEFVVKLHPENKYEKFEWIVSKWPVLKKQIIMGNISPRKVIEVSDLVIGMSSILLVEAMLAEKTVVSLQLDSKVGPQLVSVRVEAIPFVKDRDEAKRLLEILLCDDGYKREYLQKQSEWQIKNSGTQNCLNMLRKIFNEHQAVKK